MSVRVTQSTTELSFQSGAGLVRLSQGTAEISFQSGVGLVRLSQGTAEISFQSGVGLVRLSQVAVEVSTARNLLRKLRPVHAITAWRKKPFLKPRLGFLQNAALLAAAPVYPPGHFLPHIITARRAQAPAGHRRPYVERVPLRRRPGPLAWVMS